MLKNNVEVDKLTISVRTHIKLEDIKNLLDSASRGSNYWCRSDLGYESETEQALTLEGIKVEDTEDRNFATTIYTLNVDKIKKGFTVMAKKYPEHFADFLKEDYDQNTGDVFLQCCLFGGMIYG